jgi:Methylamine utilisation protein MauE
MLLIVILVVSALAKLHDHPDTVSVFGKLALPRILFRLRTPRLLPYGELVVAALLVLLPGHSYLIATSLALLLFVSYLVVVLRLDHPADGDPERGPGAGRPGGLARLVAGRGGRLPLPGPR